MQAAFPNSRKGRYRFTFNGKENDNEVKGQGNWQDYGMRIYDPRLGRFPSVDPITKKFPMLTPYQFASNNPIRLIDIDGLEGGEPPDNTGQTTITTEVSGSVINRVYTTTTTTPDFTYRMGETITTRREQRIGRVNPDGTFTFEIEVEFRPKSTQFLNPGQVAEQVQELENDIERLGGASDIQVVGFTKGVPWADDNDPNPALGRETLRHSLGNDGQQGGSRGQNEVSGNIEREQGVVTWGSWLDLGEHRAEALKGLLSGENQANTTAVANTDPNDTNDRRATLIVTPSTP